MKTISRRSFLAGVGAASLALTIPKGKAYAYAEGGNIATLIDLSKCDGCLGRKSQQCVSACRSKNAGRFPEPDPKMLKPYWPQSKFEDWSSKRDLTNRLTPYNWTFVQTVQVEHEGKKVAVNIPRRCMHCDNPPCVKLCPFGVLKKEKNGIVHIDQGCFGGAKCRTVCPWSVPQRQAGTGIYTYLDPMPVGGGEMHKCDLCLDLVNEGKEPACMSACPRKAMVIGEKSAIMKAAKERAEALGGYLYGDTQNGGTATIYVSPVPFERIDEAILASAKDPQKAMRMHEPGNVLESTSDLAKAALAAPLIGAVAAFASTVSKEKKNG